MNLFIEISLLLVTASVISLIMQKLKQPLIIGHIITGLIVGPAFLGLIANHEALDAFSKFGTVLLLFVIGLGLNPKIIKEVGKVSFFAGIGQILITSLLGFLIAIILKFDTISAIYIAIALTFSSTIVVLKLLSDRKDQNKLYGKIAIGLLLVQDITATFALISASAIGKGDLSIQAILIMILKLALLSVGIYLFYRLIIKKISKFISKSTEMLFLFAISWGFGVASLTAICGFSIEAGALFAGVMLASSPYAQEISLRLKPLRDFFIVLFFITLGSTLDLSGMKSVLIPAIILSLFVLIAKPIIVYILMNILGYTKKTSLKTGLTIAQISEFSIIFIILGQSYGQVEDSAVYLVTFVALCTIAASTYMINYSNQIYGFLAKVFPFLHDHNGRSEIEKRSKYSAVLFGYRKGGHEFINLFKQLKKKYIVIDYDPDTIEILERHNITHLYGDAQDPELMEEIGLDKVKIIISTITDFETSMYLVKRMAKINPKAIVIVYAENIKQLEQLYDEGASYAMMPHYIGSEKMSSFIKRSGFDKKEFDKMREKNIAKLKSHLL